MHIKGLFLPQIECICVRVAIHGIGSLYGFGLVLYVFLVLSILRREIPSAWIFIGVRCYVAHLVV